MDYVAFSQIQLVGHLEPPPKKSNQSKKEWFSRKLRTGDSGAQHGITTAQYQLTKELESEVREFKLANEILRKAAIFFAPEIFKATREISDISLIIRPETSSRKS